MGAGPSPYLRAWCASLRRWRATALREAAQRAEGWSPDALVFGTVRGHPRRRDAVAQAMRRIAARAGLVSIGPRGLRHTHASLLLARGLPIAEVARRLGHAGPQITLRVYSHALGADAAVARIAGALVDAP